MEYVTQRFENTQQGLRQKDAYSAQMAAQGYRIVTEQMEAGHAKGGEQCCLFAACMPCVFLAGRTPGTIAVTYGRDSFACPDCGSGVWAGSQCGNCLRLASEKAQQATSGTMHAQQATIAAQKNIAKIETLLKDCIAIDYRFNWESLHTNYPVAPPQLPPEPAPQQVPFLVRLAQALPVLENILPPLLRRRLKWVDECEAEDLKRSVEIERHAHAIADWQRSKEFFLKQQQSDIEQKQHLYQTGDRDALVIYWTKILEQSIYLETSPCVRRVDFLAADRRLIIEYALPHSSLLPKIEAVRYSQQENVLIEIPISDARLKYLYCDLLVKTSLIAMHKMFQSDVADSLNSVVFNGTVNIIDTATGREIHPCVIAVATEKSAFMDMNLSLIDPVACFRRLNGRISDNLVELTAIEPIT